MRHVRWLLILFVTSACASGSGGVNTPEQQDKPYLLLISIDGFRWDYQDLYTTPALDELTAAGVRAEAMVPVFPTLTFPNHYSIATGLYPANHRLIGNYFPSQDRTRFYSLRDRESVQDGSWYAGQPVWVAAENNGMVSAAYYFVGTEAPINDVAMTYWHQFDASVPGEDRVEKALQWLSMPADSRPHMITLYFEDVDEETHEHGPGSPQSIAAIKRVDRYLAMLQEGIRKLPIAEEIYVVVVSDHGQGGFVDNEQPFIMDSVVDLEDFIVVDHGTSAFIYSRTPDQKQSNKQQLVSVRDALNDAWSHGTAILREDAPAAWRVTKEAGFADIIVQADPGYAVFSTARSGWDTHRGDHGWAPEFADMHGIFIANGPRLPKGTRIPPINNVDVYPLLMEILGLPITTPIDGNPTLLPSLLSP